jgi:phosphoglycerol transferase MdoB-like AlkP superfamily enzyme
MLATLKIPKLIRWIFCTGIIFLLLMSLLRLALFFFSSGQDNHLSEVGSSFVLGMRYDLRDVCVLLIIMLVIGSIPRINPFQSRTGKKIILIITGVAAFLMLLFYILDFAYYSYLSQRLNANVLNFLQDAAISAKMVWQTYPVIQIILELAAGTWLINWIIKRFYKKIRKEKPVSSKKSRITWFIVCFLLFAWAIFGRFSQYPLRWSDAFALGSEYKGNLALNPFESFLNTLVFISDKYDPNKVKEAYKVLAPYYDLDSNNISHLNFTRNVSSKTTTVKTPPNVVIVICESFAAYRSSMFNNPLNTTPYFKNMCDHGIFFDRCFTPGFSTAKGVWSVVTGIPDVSSSSFSRNPSTVDQHTIMNDFSGYEKFYFIGGSTSWANIRGLLKNNIDDLHLYEQDNYNNSSIDVWGISDKNLFLNANKVFAQQSKPFVAIIQTADNHRPYTIPKEDENEFKRINVSDDSLRKSGFKSIDEMNAFRYTDFCYQKFIEAASKEKYFDNTIFLFVGDHGIPGDADDMFPKAWTDQGLTTQHVPLLIYAPKLLAPKRIHDYCSQLDALPTLAGLCNINYRNTTLGRDLLDSAHITGKNFSFICVDYIGIVQGNYFFRKQLKTGSEEMVSVINNDAIPVNPQTDEIKNNMRTLAQSFYEAAKYIASNNKKKR